MPPVVLDASAAVELLLRTPSGQRAEAALRGHSVVIPAHFDAEVLSALGRLVRGGEVAERLVELILVNRRNNYYDGPFDQLPDIYVEQTGIQGYSSPLASR